MYLKQVEIPPVDDSKKPDVSELLTVDEACRSLRISRWSFYQLVHRRKLATIQVGRRRLVPKAAITAFIERRLEATS
jgi:excisionase family DNA binding protein